jgi:hypothetical protein
LSDFYQLPPEKGQPDASGFSVLMAPGAAVLISPQDEAQPDDLAEPTAPGAAVLMSPQDDAQPDALAEPTAPGAAVLMSPEVDEQLEAQDDAEPTAPGAAAVAPEQQVSPVEQHCVSPSWL